MSSQTKYQVHSVRKNRFSNGIKIEKCWVKMKDKIKIGLTLCFPKSLKYKKFPAILQASPYRKDDDVLDLKTNTFFARHGYVSCQMDVRGTGASEGVFRDEYTKEEFRDIIEIINWLAHAPWSSGRVGIWGMSYSANNSLNIASLNPAPLKAIIAIDSSDHRYKDDVHYYGGCLQVFENIWSFGLDVEIFFPAWPNYSLKNPYFLKRFNSEPLIFRWLKHQTDGPYWQRGSLAPNYAKIRAPVYLIGGWLDGYTNSLKRIFEGLKGPKKVLVGPWPHALPDKIGPWPRIDWENESLKWWDYWLKGIDNKIMKEPEFTFYLQSYYPPSDFRLKNLKRIPGQWYSLKSNSFTFRKKTYFPSQNNQLKEEKSSKIFLNKIKYNPTLGISSKTWAPNGDGSYGLNQAKEDRLCLSFTTPPLSKKIEILGSPKCTLWVSSPVEKMNWVVRINDVAPDGT